MRLIVDLEVNEPALGVALDDALFEGVRAGGDDVIRFWVNDRAVVIGRSQSLADEVDLPAAEQHGFEVVRRMSGGGAVLHYPGNLNLSLVLANAQRLGSVETAFDLVGAAIVSGLERLGARARVAVHALFSADAKISGSAQARRGNCVLYHATLLVKPCPVSMPDILRAMREGYHARGVASRPQPVTSLEESLGHPVPLGDAVEKVTSVLIRWLDTPCPESAVTAEELERAKTLVDERYGRWTWTASR